MAAIAAFARRLILSGSGLSVPGPHLTCRSNRVLSSLRTSRSFKKIKRRWCKTWRPGLNGRSNAGPGTDKPLPERISRRAKAAMAAMEPHISAPGLTFNRFIEEGDSHLRCAGGHYRCHRQTESRYLDVGLAVSYLLLAAQAKGLATCPIGLITAYNDDISPDAQLFPKIRKSSSALHSGMRTFSGKAFRTGRADLKEIVTWYELIWATVTGPAWRIKST